MEIQDETSWWATIDDNWPDILEIFDRFLKQKKIPEGVTPGLAVAVRDDTTVDVFAPSRTLLHLVESAKRDRDPEPLLRVLNAAWHVAPDEPWIHSIPGWGVLCDLCSEDWVFVGEKEDKT